VRLRLLQEQTLGLTTAGQNVAKRSFVCLPCTILWWIN